MIMTPTSQTHPASPVDACMFPPLYNVTKGLNATNTGSSSSGTTSHGNKTTVVAASRGDSRLSLSVDAKLEPTRPLDAAIKKEKDTSFLLHESELQPFEYHHMKPSERDASASLVSVFGDADLINSIMTSLEAEAHNAAALAASASASASAAAAAAASPLSLPLTMAPTLVRASTAPVTGFKCIRKPGTFLNKDGRWIKGKPCRIGNCDKRAQSSGLCKGHGGGARCSVESCSKSSQGGGLCRAHGGGKRCLHDGCEKGTQRNGFCYLHGGVRPCCVEGCDRKDRGNGKCFAHGGGRRCQAPYCATTIRKGTYCDKHVASSSAASAHHHHLV